MNRLCGASGPSWKGGERCVLNEGGRGADKEGSAGAVRVPTTLPRRLSTRENRFKLDMCDISSGTDSSRFPLADSASSRFKRAIDGGSAARLLESRERAVR